MGSFSSNHIIVHLYLCHDAKHRRTHCTHHAAPQQQFNHREIPKSQNPKIIFLDHFGWVQVFGSSKEKCAQIWVGAWFHTDLSHYRRQPPLGVTSATEEMLATFPPLQDVLSQLAKSFISLETYVPSTVVRYLTAGNNPRNLQPVSVEVVMLATDICSFTPLSEKCSLISAGSAFLGKSCLFCFVCTPSNIRPQFYLRRISRPQWPGKSNSVTKSTNEFALILPKFTIFQQNSSC